MNRVVFIICLTLLSWPLAARANDDIKQKLIGVWRLESFFIESVETKEKRNLYGENPNGYLIITPDRLMTVITGQGRKAAQTDDERAALLRTMFAYTGTYKANGDRLTTKVDVREVAQLLGIPEGTVKSRLFLARAALAERLTCLANDSGRR